MKMTLNTIGTVEELINCIEGNKKNTVINSILTRAFFSGFANETLIEHISQKEIKKIFNKIKKIKGEFLVQYNEGSIEKEEETKKNIETKTINYFK